MEGEEKEKPKVSERFNAKWNQTDELCPTCGTVLKYSKGLTKQNVKRLFSVSTKVSDWITLFIIIMVLFMAWAYGRDLQQCRDFTKNIDKVCLQYNSHNIQLKNQTNLFIGLDEANLTIVATEQLNENESTYATVNQTENG